MTMPPAVPQAAAAEDDKGSPSPGASGGGGESIRVAVRFRPLNSKEQKQLGVANDDDGAQGRAWRVLPEGTHSITQRDVERVRGQTLFSFDAAYDESRTTADVFNGIGRNVVDGALSGIDGTIFAYGQTGSGKTFTMQGPDGAGGSEDDENGDGIAQMAARQLFWHVESQADREFLVRTSFVEVYNEIVRDLLRGPEEDGAPPLTVREDPKRGGVYMNCHEVVVTDFASLMDTLRSGELNRIVASTDMNSRSSRSHAIFRITVESRERKTQPSGGEDGSEASDSDEDGKDDRAVLVSTLNLVDLAGSESVRHTGATGQRQREGGKINQSLLTLSQVINSLSLPVSRRPRHINYRDSKLTRILQASLSGNARMAVLCCASPSSLYIEETRSTLKFASRAKMVQTKARKNEVMDDRALIRRLQRELAEAKRALAATEMRENEMEEIKSTLAASEERAKLERLKSMILHGGTLFGWQDHKPSQGREDRMPRGGTLSQSLPFFASLNPATMQERHSSTGCLSTSFGDAPANVAPESGRRQRQPKRCSIGVMRIAHHNDADVLLQIYEESEGSSDDEGKSKIGEVVATARRRRSDTLTPVLSPIEEGGGATQEQKPAAESSQRTKTSNRDSKKYEASSETDILREALAAKSDVVRSLQSQLRASESKVESLQSQLASMEERVQPLELKRCATCRLANEPQPANASARSDGGKAQRAEAKAKWLRFLIHTLVVVLSSVILFFAQKK